MKDKVLAEIKDAQQEFQELEAQRKVCLSIDLLTLHCLLAFDL